MDIIEEQNLDEAVSKISTVLLLPLLTEDYVFNEILKSVTFFSLEYIKNSLKQPVRLVDSIPSLLKYTKFIKYQPLEILKKLRCLNTPKKILVARNIVSSRIVN